MEQVSIQQPRNATALRHKTRRVKSSKLSHGQWWIFLIRQLLAIILLFSQHSPGWQCLRSSLCCWAVSTQISKETGRAEATLLSLDCFYWRNVLLDCMKSKKNCCWRARSFNWSLPQSFCTSSGKRLNIPYASVLCCQLKSVAPAQTNSLTKPLFDGKHWLVKVGTPSYHCWQCVPGWQLVRATLKGQIMLRCSACGLPACFVQSKNLVFFLFWCGREPTCTKPTPPLLGLPLKRDAFLHYISHRAVFIWTLQTRIHAFTSLQHK